MSLDVLKSLFEQHFHASPTRVQPLQGEFGGSGRKIIRLANDRITAVGILYGGREENVAFLAFSKHFRRHGLPVPEIYAEDLDHGAYLEQDLGDTTLFEFLSKNRTGENIAPAVVEAYRKVVAILPRFQIEAASDLDYSVCYPAASFDRQSIAWDLNYFKYYFLRLAGIPFNEHALESDFNRLTDLLLGAPRDYFLYRDFQSRNIMLCDGQPYFVDYQGGRTGALQYDLASLLFDAKADLPPELRDHLLYDYLRALANYIPVDREAFLHHFYAYVYVRIMQALGAYGYRGFFERRAHFLQSVPYALKNIRWLVHGRGLPNPGREERFKSLTGRDTPVINYLHQQESVHQFLASVFSLIDATVENYHERGFKNLMVSFGCTGGQHRSVYLAEQLAKHLRGRNGVEVVVRHLELEKLGLLHAVVGNLAE